MLVVIGGVFVAFGGIFWLFNVRRIRSKFVNSETGDLIPGSDNLPMFDYIFHGFMGRNTLAPFGDFELSFFLGFPCVLVSEPKIIKELVKGNGLKEFDKGELTLAGVEPIAGRQNLFSSDGHLWQHQRGIINPAFRPASMRLLIGTVVSTVNETVSKWFNDGKAPDDISVTISNLTLEIICRSAFGIEGPESQGNINQTIAEAYKTILNSLMLKMLGLGFFGSDKALADAAGQIEKLAQEGMPLMLIICLLFVFDLSYSFVQWLVLDSSRAKAQNGMDDSSLIALLVSARQTNEITEITQDADSEAIQGRLHGKSSLTDREIIDNIKVFLFAGHDSTTSTILWILYLLALHPSYQDKVMQEMRDHNVECRSDSPEEAATKLTLDNLKQLTFSQCIIKETLRLFPPAWAINRSPKQDLVVGGYVIPKGTSIMINTLRLHRREDLGWDKPFDFVPERWLTDQPCHEKSSFCYMPFGGGPRSCVGQPLAEAELWVVVVKILSQFEAVIVGPVPKECEIDFFAGSTIRPKNVKNLRLVKRN